MGEGEGGMGLILFMQAAAGLNQAKDFPAKIHARHEVLQGCKAGLEVKGYPVFLIYC